MVSTLVSPPVPSNAAGTAQQFTATGTYSDASTQDLTSTVSWGSSNTAVATVSTSGLATGVAAGGPVTITARIGTISGTSSLTVTVATNQGSAGNPVVIPAMPYQGLTINNTGSYYLYTTVAIVGTITVSNMSGNVNPLVYESVNFTNQDNNWTRTSFNNKAVDTCTATTPVPAGTILYIRVSRKGNGPYTFTLNVGP